MISNLCLSIVHLCFTYCLQKNVKSNIFFRSTCTLSLWLNEYIRTVFLDRQHSKVATTVESITKQADAWHAITTPEQMQELIISRPLLSVYN